MKTNKNALYPHVFSSLGHTYVCDEYIPQKVWNSFANQHCYPRSKHKTELICNPQEHKPWPKAKQKTQIDLALKENLSSPNTPAYLGYFEATNVWKKWIP